jgi:hypothetical protein
MPHLDIYLIVPSAALMMPLAGLGRCFRLDATQIAPVVVPTQAIATTRRTGLSMRWRKDSAGMLVMEWTG